MGGDAEDRMTEVHMRERPTRRQLEVLRAYIATGSIVAAAYQLDINGATARQHLSALYRRTGCTCAAQAAYLLGHADAAGDKRKHGSLCR